MIKCEICGEWYPPRDAASHEPREHASFVGHEPDACVRPHRRGPCVRIDHSVYHREMEEAYANL